MTDFGRDPAFAASPSSPVGSSPSGLQSGVGHLRPMAALNQVLLELRLSEQVFRQYGMQHLDKAEAVRDDDLKEYNARMQKAFRNAQRADCCKRALDFFEENGGVDAYAPALAAGSRRAKTPTAVECEASQSGGDSRNALGGPA